MLGVLCTACYSRMCARMFHAYNTTAMVALHRAPSSNFRKASLEEEYYRLAAWLSRARAQNALGHDTDSRNVV